eukprot:10103428-Alexandrium_andersonii.AAC.1
MQTPPSRPEERGGAGMATSCQPMLLATASAPGRPWAATLNSATAAMAAPAARALRSASAPRACHDATLA